MEGNSLGIGGYGNGGQGSRISLVINSVQLLKNKTR